MDEDKNKKTAEKPEDQALPETAGSGGAAKQPPGPEKHRHKHRAKHAKRSGRLKRFFAPLNKFFNAAGTLLTNRFFGNMFAQAGIIACCLLLFIESIEYKEVFGGFRFLLESPLAFLLNALIIFVALTPAWLFRSRIFFYCLFSTPWIIIGVVNGFVLSYRMTPFTTADMEIMDMGFELLPTYMTTPQMIIASAVVLVVIAVYVLIFRFAPKREKGVKFRLKSLAAIIASAVLLFGGWNFSIKVGIVSDYFQNLWDAYHAYGVPYCFLSTWLNRGISKPADYSEANVDALFAKGALEDMSSKEGKTQADYPNIVFLQLESFIDPTEIRGLTFSRTPTPYYEELKAKNSTGYLTVPVVGGGTANTELEVMSGMSMKFFGPGEFPYKSLLRTETCETMAYDLKRLGYSTHVIHNHKGAFYNRNTVFPDLGYDDFTSLEYMNYVTKTPKGFARDDVLTGEIMGAMDSTADKDYVYCVSVQGHGEYPKSNTIKDPQITVSGAKSKAEENMYEYYLEQVSEMDDFLRVLTDELSSYKEKVVLVLYGDHLPPLSLEKTDLKSGSTFKTQYVIWANYPLQKEDKDLAAYQLSAELQRRIGMREGTLTVYHQDSAGKTGYLDGLNMLQYDMLYGDRYVYGGKTPFLPVKMNMGYSPIRIDDIVEVAGQLYIKGEGFTPSSKVSLNGKVLATSFMGPTVLRLLDEVDPSNVPNLKVSQVENNNSILSTTE